jgi:prolyl-tRNA editing enzyme YbaK/EbsC (Cys-tRNA(Pro) deacylase)
MTRSLHKNAQKVQQALHAKDMDCRVVELPSSTRTAEEAAQSIGCQIGQIAKSLIFRLEDEPILMIVSGSNRLNEKKAKKLLDRPLQRANAEWVKAQTGFPIGGIPPLGHERSMQVFIDPDLMQFEHIWAAAGTPFAVFEIPPASLHQITGAEMLPESAIKRPSV